MTTHVSLFSGIGGFDLGLKDQFDTALFCEINKNAQAILAANFPNVEIKDDIQTIRSLPDCEVLSAGFPCNDLSMSGNKEGIKGAKSGLVDYVFDLVRKSNAPRWIVLENVPYMLRLKKGQAVSHITTKFEELGYHWAYRVVDARFAVPQRRPRVIFLASRTEDPCRVLFADDSDLQFDDSVTEQTKSAESYGFYWTEGRRGLGWTVNGVPPIKAGSLGIPCPPAVWIPDASVVGTPVIQDLERLQGFPSDWTKEATYGPGSPRFSLVGNAICVPVVKWLSKRLTSPGERLCQELPFVPWPNAAFRYRNGKIHGVRASAYPEHTPQSLRGFLQHAIKPLSSRAAQGFLSRLLEGNVFSPSSLRNCLRKME